MRAENIGETQNLTFINESGTCLRDFTFKYIFIAGMAVNLYYHSAFRVQRVLKRDIIQQCRSNFSIRFRIVGIVSAYNNLKTVVKECFGDFITIVCGGLTAAVLSFVVLVLCQYLGHKKSNFFIK